MPVTATQVAGKRWKKRAAICAKARRGLASAICTAPSTGASGRATTAIAPGRDRRRNEILAIEVFADEGAEDRPRRDLAVIDGEAGDDRIGARTAL